MGFLGGLRNLADCPAGAFAFVGRTEHFDEDFAHLVAALQARGALMGTLPLRLRPAHVMPQRLAHLRHLGECARENLRHWYHEDYEIISHLIYIGALPASYAAEINALGS